MQGHTPSRLPTDQALRMSAPDHSPLALFVNVQPATPSGKVELVSDVLAQRWGAEQRLPGYRNADAGGLALISPASDKRISSTLMGAGGRASEAPALLMNPEDARHRKLESATRVRVFNALGSVVLPLQITQAVPPGVVSSEKGAWIATSPTGQTISALVSADARADLADGACYNDTRVEVQAA
jgi:anaerobic selenocysteine-containing dehydrogenase